MSLNAGFMLFFFSSRRRHTRCALVTGVQTCALPIYHPGSWQAQRAKLQASPRCGRLHVLAARPAKSQMVENLGTMPSPRSAEPVIALKLCRRCSDLLGKIRNHGIRKLAGAATKASRRTVQEQLRGKAEPRRRRKIGREHV